ncbi:hypothetical protein [Mycolicibacterium hodleri]|uniref:DUF5666 domain-containing protein n=1 Tax=Mycolicibacterium hodleri TaxID=49897 RepID=A0A502E0C7_9MYCO|nr:hypothetical protein [Mycolicibacterium hodleri]TPG31238.1 hypothetical protein EAH80_24935 [Mycolicibacterium hodleri]
MSTWGMRKTVGAVAVAAAVAGVGGAAIAAATDGGNHHMSGGMRDPIGPPLPAAHRSSAEPDALHGEYVVADGHGGFSTLISQAGRVTAISATSVTARSDDGFVQTYAIHEAGGAATPPFAVGDQVIIDATRIGETTTVSTMRPPLLPGH